MLVVTPSPSYDNQKLPLNISKCQLKVNITLMELKDRLMPRSRWPKQNELHGILADLSHITLLEHFFFVLLIFGLYSMVYAFVFYCFCFGLCICLCYYVHVYVCLCLNNDLFVLAVCFLRKKGWDIELGGWGWEDVGRVGRGEL